MNKIRFILVVVLALYLNQMLACIVPGYIIKNNKDSIFGEIKISKYDTYTGGVVFNGINLEPFHSVVYFREDDKNPFKAYTPKSISDFGFSYGSTNYKFKTFVIETNSIVWYERQRYRFLNLIFQGNIAIYTDIVRKENQSISGNPSKVIDYTDYYLFDTIHGLKKSIKSKKFKTLKSLLHYYEIDENFIRLLPENTRFKDIKAILEEYENYK